MQQGLPQRCVPFLHQSPRAPHLHFSLSRLWAAQLEPQYQAFQLYPRPWLPRACLPSCNCHICHCPPASMHLPACICHHASAIAHLPSRICTAGLNQQWGLSNEIFVLGDSLILTVLGQVSFMPVLVLAARLCPEVPSFPCSSSPAGFVLVPTYVAWKMP